MTMRDVDRDDGGLVGGDADKWVEESGQLFDRCTLFYCRVALSSLGCFRRGVQFIGCVGGVLPNLYGLALVSEAVSEIGFGENL